MSAERPQKRKVDWWTMGPAVGLMAICAAAFADSQGYTPGDIDLDFFKTKKETEEVCRVKADDPSDTLGSLALQCMPGATPAERQKAIDEVAMWQNGGSLKARHEWEYEFPLVEISTPTTTEP